MTASTSDDPEALGTEPAEHETEQEVNSKPRARPVMPGGSKSAQDGKKRSMGQAAGTAQNKSSRGGGAKAGSRAHRDGAGGADEADDGAIDQRSTPARARRGRTLPRSQQRLRSETEVIIQDIAEQMATGRWLEVTKPHRRIAEKYKMSEGNAKHLAMRAWERVRPHDGEVDRLRLSYRARLEGLSLKAEAGADLKTATLAIDKAALVAGLYKTGNEVTFHMQLLERGDHPLLADFRAFRDAVPEALSQALLVLPEEQRALVLQRFADALPAAVSSEPQLEAKGE